MNTQNCIYDIKSLDEDTNLNLCRTHVIVFAHLKCMQGQTDRAFTNFHQTGANPGLNLEIDEYSHTLCGKGENSLHLVFYFFSDNYCSFHLVFYFFSDSMEAVRKLSQTCPPAAAAEREQLILTDCLCLCIVSVFVFVSISSVFVN